MEERGREWGKYLSRLLRSLVVISVLILFGWMVLLALQKEDAPWILRIWLIALWVFIAYVGLKALWL